MMIFILTALLAQQSFSGQTYNIRIGESVTLKNGDVAIVSGNNRTSAIVCQGSSQDDPQCRPYNEREFLTSAVEGDVPVGYCNEYNYDQITRMWQTVENLVSQAISQCRISRQVCDRSNSRLEFQVIGKHCSIKVWLRGYNCARS